MAKQKAVEEKKGGSRRMIHASLIYERRWRMLEAEPQAVFLTLKLLLGSGGIGLVRPGTMLYHIAGLTFEGEARALQQLEEAGWIARDEVDSVVWIIKGLKWESYFSLDNPKHRKPIEDALKRLPECVLANDMAGFYGIDLPFPHRGISGRYPAPEGTPVRAPMAQVEPKKEQVKDQPPALTAHQVATAVAEYLCVDGEYLEGWSLSRHRSVAAEMLKAGYKGEAIIDAAEGLRLLVETTDEIQVAAPGEPVSLGLLWKKGGASTNLFQRAAEFAQQHRLAAQRREMAERLGDNGK